MPRRLKNSVIRYSGAFRLPGRPATTRSSLCSTISKCLADGGTRSTISESNVTSPTRSRCFVLK